MGVLTVSVVNAWSGTFTQPTAFGTMPPALESVVITLNSGSSVGGGSGTPTAGNWLITLVAMNEHATTSGCTVAVNDDIRSFWRPGNETTSTWAVSTGTALTRTAAWYTANTASVAGNIYVAPSGPFDALAVLVLEVGGLGPWDTVAGINTSYAAAATSLSLSLAAPASTAFIVGATGGDSTSATQAFAPSGWTTLPTVSVTDGSDHLCDAVLTSAWHTTTGSTSVSGTAGSATDLSGVLLSVLTTGTSPISALANPNWPLMKVEAAFGGGFQTPPDELTWADLTSRTWSWDETTGIQYQLGQVQATNLNLELDNYDGNLSYDNPSGTWYPHVVTGTPIRIRAAIGSIGGVTVNRWYCISRNAEEWPQEITDIYRRYAPATGTDIWSALSASDPTPYRGEVTQDSPYAWWPCDDQPLAGGVLPTSLQNAALGNTNVLIIQPTSAGVAPGDAYGTAGTDLTTDGTGETGIPDGNPPPSVAVYQVAEQQGWLYGDPQSAGTSAQTGNPVTAQPGSAAWQQTGLQGDTGSNSWFLACNDTSFPALSGGISFGFWFMATFNGTVTGFEDNNNINFDIAGQPFAAITLATLATASAPVMIFRIAQSGGALDLITYNGATATTHSIYSTSDMRSNSWHHVMVTTTASAWTCYVDGGLTATASGSGAGMTSAWTWLAMNADFGAGGGSSLTSNAHGGNVAYSHIQVFPSILPAWRILAQYAAGIDGCGLLPAPQGVQVTPVLNEDAGIAYTPDGSEYNGSYGFSAPSSLTSYSFSALAVSVAGSVTSGPSARNTIAGIGGYGEDTGEQFGAAVWVGWTAVAPTVKVYTNDEANTETEAAACCGSGDSFTEGYGSGATGGGVCQTAAGTGAAYPTAPSTLGDTASQRMERVLGYANATYPGRCVDAASTLPVQAATDIGGEACAQNLTNIAESDGGLMFIDSQGNFTYWSKSHLASQYSSPTWTLGPAASGASVIPYSPQIKWTADPQRVWNFITITPFSPDGATLPVIVPTSASGVLASQAQYGSQPLPVTSYLQSPSEMQSQANYLFTNFGQLQIRVENLKVDAATYPAAWPFVLGVSVGDVVAVQNWQIGGGGTTGTFRVSSIKRRIVFGGQTGDVAGEVTLQADYESSSYWD